MTVAAAHRWLDAHLGATIATVQSDQDERTTWSPQDRTLSKQFTTSWLLDGSTVRITREHTVVAVTDTALVLDWHDERGRLIHRTTYTVVEPATVSPGGSFPAHRIR